MEVKSNKHEAIVPGQEEWFLLVERIVTEFEIGQLIPHDWLKAMFGIKQLDLQFFPDMESVRKAIQEQQFLFLQLFERLRKDVLKNHNFYLVNVRGLGYKIIHPKDQTGFAYNQLIEDIKSSFKECGDIMSHVRNNHVDEEQRAKDRHLFSKVGTLKQLFEGFRK
jgi:hypothetical protein